MRGLSGFASYFVRVSRAFARFRPPRFEVRARGFAETGNMMMVEVCNGTTAGGSYRFAPDALPGDRKSTRLNSSHLVISYAVFCLKKKKHVNPDTRDDTVSVAHD